MKQNKTDIGSVGECYDERMGMIKDEDQKRRCNEFLEEYETVNEEIRIENRCGNTE